MASLTDEEEELVCLLATKNKRRRRWYVRPLNTTRDEDGEFNMLVRDMRNMDEEKHFQYFRMNCTQFDDLTARLAPSPSLLHRG